MRRINVHEVDVGFDEDDRPGYHAGYFRIASAIGGAMIGASVYELGTDESICPYHYEYGNEEWLLVVSGTPTLRHPEGEDELRPGDVVCFPVGPEGAHKVTNRAAGATRVVMFSTKTSPEIAVYPDSDKIGVWPGDARDNLIVRREASVDYWDREP